MSNLLTRLGISIEHFSIEERAAQAKAEVLTTKAKALVESKAVLTLEAITGTEQYGAAADLLLTRLCTILASPVVADDLDMISGTLGRWGAMLTAEFHNHEHSTLSDYVRIFEDLFALNKTA